MKRMRYKEFKKKYGKVLHKPTPMELSIIEFFAMAVIISAFTDNIVAALYFTVFLLFFKQFIYLIYLITGEKK